MRGSSNKFLSIINSRTPNDVFLFLVTVTYPDNSVERFVKNYEPITSRGETYQPVSFEVNLPEEPEDSVPTVNFAFAVTETSALRKLRQSTDLPKLKLEMVLASDPDVVEMGPYEFSIRSFSVEGVAVNVEAGFFPILDLAIPQLTYNPILFRGLFKDV